MRKHNGRYTNEIMLNNQRESAKFLSFGEKPTLITKNQPTER